MTISEAHVFRRLALLAALFLTSLAAWAPVSPAGAGDNWKTGSLQPLTSTLPAMLPGQTGWAGISWTADTNVCDVRITASAPGATISYPANTGSYTSLYVNDALAETNRDYSALKIQVPASASGSIRVTLNVSFNRLPPGQIKKTDDLTYVEPDCSRAKDPGSLTTTVTLPVTTPTGAKATLQTTSVTVPRDTPTWVPLSFTTQHAGLADFRVTLTPPPGLTVVYPGDGRSSGLANDSTLPVGGSDSASVRLDASGLEPGTHQVPVRATWSGGSVDTTLTLTVR